MTCSRCEDLQEEVAYLKSELGLQIDGGEVAAVSRALGVTGHKAKLLLILYRAKGRVVTIPQLEDALPPRYETSDRTSNFPTATISQLRKVVGATAIETFPNRGYRLSDAMRLRMTAVLA